MSPPPQTCEWSYNDMSKLYPVSSRIKVTLIERSTARYGLACSMRLAISSVDTAAVSSAGWLVNNWFNLSGRTGAGLAHRCRHGFLRRRCQQGCAGCGEYLYHQTDPERQQLRAQWSDSGGL